MEQAVKMEIESKSVFDVTVSNCLIRDMSLSSTVNLSGPKATFANNRCYDWAGGLIFNSHGIATGNYFENCGSLAEVQATINVQTAGVYPAEGDFVFADNVIIDSPYRGISCTVGKMKATGNVIRNAADRAINTGGADNTITGNTVDGATFGIVMSSTMATSVVAENTFTNCSSSVYSFTFNAAFTSVILRSNVGTEPSFHNVIAGGVVLGGLSPGMYTLGTEGGAGTDDLDTITPATNTPRGHTIVLSDNSSAQDVTVKHNTGNIILVGAADFAMATTSAKIALMWSGTKWQELWRATA
jgi:parallel beta-helix repeat protein